MKVMLVFGTRPEAIKMCPIVLELRKYNDVKTVVCVTGQHKEMLKQVLDAFQIIPEYDLQIMKQNQTLCDITSRILLEISDVLTKEKPDFVLVHGDTTTAFAASLACFYLRIPVAHVEAGLRTYNKYSPFPEEMNRQIIDILADIYFAPTENAKKNLLFEGKQEKKIYVTGNTVIDALKTTVTDTYWNPLLDWVGDSRLILLTAHRRENLGVPMKEMFAAIKSVVNEFQDIKIIYPVHLNPEVRTVAEEILGHEERIKLVAPMDVVDFHNMMNYSYFILTDSGGIQEEASSLGKPVLVMRDTTERPEGVEAGTLMLVGTKKQGIANAMKELLTDQHKYQEMSQAVNPYGDGRASEKIVDIIYNKMSS